MPQFIVSKCNECGAEFTQELTQDFIRNGGSMDPGEAPPSWTSILLRKVVNIDVLTGVARDQPGEDTDQDVIDEEVLACSLPCRDALMHRHGLDGHVPLHITQRVSAVRRMRRTCRIHR